MRAEDRRSGLLLLVATLNACPLQELAVLLFTHALAALFNERSHEVAETSGVWNRRNVVHQFG